MGGLLVCDMHQTAFYVISNLLDDIETYGFVPNGGRIYYTDRSQPPMLSEMVMSYLNYMEDRQQKGNLSKEEEVKLDFFRVHAFTVLQKEYNWWMNESNMHGISLQYPGNIGTPPKRGYLNHYYSAAQNPRPGCAPLPNFS